MQFQSMLICYFVMVFKKVEKCQQNEHDFHISGNIELEKLSTQMKMSPQMMPTQMNIVYIIITETNDLVFDKMDLVFNWELSKKSDKFLMKTWNFSGS